MHFAFSDEQHEMREAVASALQAEVTGDALRAAWEQRPATLWSTLGELGVLGINAPEDVGGLGMGPLDWVLLQQEAGRVALPEPWLEALALLPAIAGTHPELAAKVCAGQAKVTVFEAGTYALDAEVAELVVVLDGEYAYAVPEPELEAQPSIDGARRLFSVSGGREPLDCDPHAIRQRASLAASAQLVGLGRRVLDMAVGYSKERQQFGKHIGSFQAVQHHLADALLKLSFAEPLVHQAAWSLHTEQPEAATHVAMAKIHASEAASFACRKSLQVHGAIGYTFEFDLHLYMKRAWALGASWGDPAQHRDAVAAAVLGV